MSELPYYYGEGPDPLHRDCGGEVFFFKEGPICGKCGASSDWEPVPDPERDETPRSVPHEEAGPGGASAPGEGARS